jgi:predicted GNAT family acetyltransferase
MKIVQYDNGKKGIFQAQNENAEIGEMSYIWAGDNKIIIDSTSVKPDFEEQGVGTQLVMKAVDFAREKNIKILPLCPFAKSVFMKNKDITDVLV